MVHRIKKTGQVFVAAFFLWQGIVFSLAAETADTADILTQVEKSLNAIQSMKSRFIQRAPDGSVTEGMFYLERPGKMRFDFGDQAPFLLVSNGHMLTFIDYEVNQISRWPLSKTPLAILTDKTIHFDSDMTVPEITRLAGLLRLTVVNQEHQEYGHIELIFEESTMALQAWESIDAQGYRTRVALVNPEYNIPVDGQRFTYTDPRGPRHGPRN